MKFSRRVSIEYSVFGLMIVFFITQKQYQWFLYYLLLIFDIHSFIRIHSFIYSSAIRLMKLCAFPFCIRLSVCVFFIYKLHFIWNFHLSLKKVFFIYINNWMDESLDKSHDLLVVVLGNKTNTITNTVLIIWFPLKNAP